MEIFIAVIFFIVIGVFFQVFKLDESNKKHSYRPKYSYFRKANFMTEREKVFFWKLRSVCGDNLVVFSQVRVSSLLNHKVRGQNFRAALSRINQKSVDFLLCDARDLRPLLAIELDDKTHNLPDRKKRDSEVGMPSFHFFISKASI